MKITKLIKRIPRVKRFIVNHNPSLEDLILSVGLLNKPNPIVLDVGANTGQSIDFFLKMNSTSEIYSFEPTPNIALTLRERYKDLHNVNIFELAFSDYNGNAELFVSNYSPTNSLLKPNTSVYEKFNSSLASTLAASKKETCIVETLNNWYSNNLVNKHIDLLKIDVQGAEYQVIKGGLEVLKSNVKALTIEFQYLPFYENSTPFYEQFKILFENDFYLFSFFEGFRRQNLQIIENSALFINKNFRKWDQ